MHNGSDTLQKRDDYMLPFNVTWNLKDVLIVHVLRILLGLALVGAVLQPLFNASDSVVEIMDRVIMIALVWLTIKKHHGSLRDVGFSFKGLFRNVAYGILAGTLLLFVSMYSERLYTTALLLTPTQHPLVAQVEQAVRWQQLFIPLLLAGIAAPVAEEFLYRMFTFLPLAQRWGLWGGAAGSAALFALMHFNAYWLVEMIIVGMGLAILYYKTGSLISAITAHSFINTSKILMIFWGLPLV